MGKKILLVEDDLPTIDVYKTALGSAGFEVEIITFGKKVIEELEKIKEGKKDRPDLIILDIILPDMNGLEILERIRKVEKTKNTPVLILTNYMEQQIEEMGYNLRSNRLMLKTDYTPMEIVKIVEKETKKNK